MIATRAILAPIMAMLALGSANAAQAANDACMTPAELNATLVFALPSVIETTAQICRPVLGRDGYLATQSADLAARYRMGQAAAWPVARAAVLKIAGGGLGKFADLLPDPTLQDLARNTVQQAVVQGIHRADCADIEQALALMAPLPPENTAGLIALVVRRVETSDSGKTVVAGRKLRLPLCPITAVPSIGMPDDDLNRSPKTRSRRIEGPRFHGPFASRRRDRPGRARDRRKQGNRAHSRGRRKLHRRPGRSGLD